MPRIVVTGAAGFIGSHLSDALLRTGCNVVALDNFDDFYDPDVKRRNIETALKHPRFSLVEGDIRDPEAVKQALADFRFGSIQEMLRASADLPRFEYVEAPDQRLMPAHAV